MFKKNMLPLLFITLISYLFLGTAYSDASIYNDVPEYAAPKNKYEIRVINSSASRCVLIIVIPFII